MKAYNVICRRATERDDVGAIAACIHLTDPYIYPVICDDPHGAPWKNMFSDCYFSKDNIFYFKNIYIAEIDHSIAGVLCAIACGRSYRFVEDICPSGACADGLLKANEGYFLPLIEETKGYKGFNITNVCIDPRFRGMGIGRKLMTHCLRQLGGIAFHLDVIADNTPAVRLYEKMGFAITSAYYGFSGTDEPLRCYHMVRENADSAN